MTLTEMREKFAQYETEYQALLAKEGGLSAEEEAKADSLIGECEELQKKIQATDERHTRAQNLTQWSRETPAPTQHGAAPTNPATSSDERVFAVPTSLRHRRVLNFKDRDGSTAAARAYAFGNWFLATTRNYSKSRAWCQEHGLPLAVVDDDGRITQLGHNETVNSQGGFLVPAPLETDLIDLREQFGVARRICRIRPMTSETLSIPRRTSGLTAYWLTDEDAITESTKGWDRVNLVAKKIGVLAKISSELNEDAIINVGDDLAGEIAYAFAALEDDCLINGDGSSTYGGILGCRARLQDIDGAGADSAGLHVAATGEDTWPELTLASFNACKSKLPLYADDDRVQWVVHRTFWAAVMERLALAAGGITEAMIAAGAQPRFLGYPVTFSQKMPSATAVSQVCALLGNFQLGVSFGDRRMTTIMASEHAYFANDQIGVRGTERFDINCHDLGSASAAGPVVGLQTAAS